MHLPVLCYHKKVLIKLNVLFYSLSVSVFIILIMLSPFFSDVVLVVNIVLIKT